MPSTTNARKRLASALAVLALGAMAVGCGDDDSSADDGDTASDASTSEESEESEGADGDVNGDAAGGGDGCAVDLGIPDLGAPADTAAGADVDPMSTGYGPVDIEGGPLIPFGTTEGDDPAIGCDAPALSGTNYQGEPTSFTPGDDGPTLLVFLAHWCPHCNAEVPRLIEWRESSAVPDGLNVVAVSTGISSDRPNFPPGEWLDEAKWPWPVIADTEPPEGVDTLLGDAGITYGATSFPFLTLVDADGKVVARHAGELSVEELSEFVAPVA